MAGRRYSIEATIGAADRVTKPVLKMSKAVRKFARTASTSLSKANRTVNALGSGVKRAAMAFSAAALIVGSVGVNIAKAGAGYEQAITNVGAVSMRTRDQIAALDKQARDLGRTTKFTATEAAGAMEVLSRAGFGVNDIVKVTPAILNAAAASGLEIAEVADHVSNALKGMGLATSEAARVSDVLALASSRTNSTIGSLGESLSNVASTARTLGVPLEDTVAAIALLQDVGLPASVAGSAFNTMLTKMAKPTDGIIKKMRQFGISFKNAKGDMLPLESVIEQLSIASKKSGGNLDQVAFFAELVGLRGQKAAVNLAKLFETGSISDLTAALKDAELSSKKIADIRMDTVMGSFLLLNSAVESVKISIFDLKGGPLRGLIDGMTAWVQANEKLITQKVGDFIAGIGNAIAFMVKHRKALGTAVAVLMSMAIAVKVLTGVMMIMNIVMMANPIGLIVAGIVLLVGFITLLTIKWNEWGAAVSLILGPLGILISMIKTFKKNWQGIVDAFKSDGIKAGILSIGKTILDAVLMPLEQVYKLMSKIPGMKKLAGNAASNIAALREKLVVESGSTEAATAPQMVTPQERVARTIEESRSSSSAEVTIRDETGRAELSGGSLGAGINLMSSGAFAQ